jgi:hypothetical protein
MDTTTELRAAAQLNDTLDALTRRREAVLRQASGVERAANMADLYRIEAALWASVYESATDRLLWRAALAAEAHARHSAATWWRRAIAQATPAIPGGAA